ncbi:MAG: hypothetical protein A2X94_01550 [Bdellovibrionales bacterium GWB1_55_8]|nr:MAG: hypothetical protein A2X94_01550 [Bdellovibrionales bacterium GWB1_55_8]
MFRLSLLSSSAALVLPAAFTALCAFAAPVDTISRRVEVSENTACETTESCSLLGASLTVENYRVNFSDGASFGTKAHVAYETSSLETLEDYVVVQFIRGCQFESSRKNGQVKTEHSIERELFGQIVPLVHPEWIVDSTDRDPVYNSASERGVPRHHYYRWNLVPGSFEKKTMRYYGQAKPINPRLYVQDLPGTAFATGTANNESAKNISLEFRSCIYKAKDVPEISVPENLLPEAKPVVCFDWRSSFIYDFERRLFTSQNGISESCR